MATKEHIEHFLESRYEMLKEARENGLETLEHVVLKNISDTEKMLKEFKQNLKPKQLKLWEI